MSATILTIVGLIIAALGTIAFPMWLNHNKSKNDAVSQEAMDSQAVAKMFQAERDRLQIRLDTMQADYEQRMHALQMANSQALADAEAKWRAQHERDQQQITELRAELQGLYKQLYQTRPRNEP